MDLFNQEAQGCVSEWETFKKLAKVRYAVGVRHKRCQVKCFSLSVGNVGRTKKNSGGLVVSW